MKIGKFGLMVLLATLSFGFSVKSYAGLYEDVKKITFKFGNDGPNGAMEQHLGYVDMTRAYYEMQDKGYVLVSRFDYDEKRSSKTPAGVSVSYITELEFRRPTWLASVSGRSEKKYNVLPPFVEHIRYVNEDGTISFYRGGRNPQGPADPSGFGRNAISAQ